MSRLKLLALAVIPAIFISGLSLGAFATNYTWTGNAGDGSATTAGNWKLDDGTDCTVPPPNAIDGGAVLIFDNAGTVSIACADGFKYAGYVFSGGSKVTFSDVISMGPDGVKLTGDSTFTCSKAMTFYDGTNVFDVASGSSVIYSVSPNAGPTGMTFVKRGGGDIEYKAQIKYLGTLVMEGGRFGVHTSTSTAGSYNLGATKVVMNGGTSIGTYGNDMTFAGGWQDVEGCQDHAFQKGSSGAKTITFSGAYDVYYTGHFAGSGFNPNNLNLTYNPGNANNTFTLAKGCYDCSSGTLTIQSGKMLFTDGGSIAKAVGVVVKGGAEMIIDGSAGEFALLPFTLDATALLRLKDVGVVLKVASMTVGGVAVPNGTYDADDGEFGWLKGEGILIIGNGEPTEPAEETTATWKGAGGNTLITNPENWEGGLPDLTSGTLIATFGVGSEVTVPDDKAYWLKGIVLSSSEALTIQAASSDSLLKLGSEGVTTGNGGVTYTSACPIRLCADQTWAIGSNDKVVLTASGTVDGSIFQLKKTGGRLQVYSTNRRMRKFSLAGAVELRADYALGGFGAVATIATTDAETFFEAYGVKVGCDITGTSSHQGYFLNAVSGATTIEGLVSVSSANGCYYLCATGAKLVFSGGVKYENDNNWSEFSPLYLKNSVYRMHDITVTNKPMVITRGNFDHGTLRLDVAGNNAPRGFHLGDSETLITGIDGALYSTEAGTSGIALRGNGAKLDLDGHDQAVNIFYGLSSSAMVTSGVAAVLHLVDNNFNTTKSTDGKNNLCGTGVLANHVPFSGQAGYSKEGSFTNYLMSASTSSGTLAVTKGRLVMCRAAVNDSDFAEGTTVLRAEGSWKNASALTISGTGVFVAEHNKALGRNTEVRFVGTNGRFEVPAGVTARCAALYIDGLKQREGVWTAETSPLISGKGSLFVGKPGLFIVVQ